MRTTAAILAAALAAMLGFAAGQWRAPAIADEALPPAGELGAEEAQTIALFNAARDSVVAITTAQAMLNPFSRRAVAEPVGSGSGFVWDDRGHIVTNAHVIAGADSATVHLADGRSYPARLVGYDRGHDLAVLRIPEEALPAPLAPAPGTPQVGQRVLAIGNPFGLDWTLTTGIVSALDREIPVGGGAIRGLIQTDAAINPGNSGGPLLDSRGRLLGVNTAIWSPSGASAGIGFAVPMATVARIVPQLIDTGRYVPPDLGIVADARINAAANRQGLSGVMVLDVRPGTDAAAAGITPARLSRDGRILPGDVVVALDGEAVATLDDLLARVDERSAGDAVTLTLDQDGTRREVTLRLVPGVP